MMAHKRRSDAMDNHVKDYYNEASDEVPSGNFHRVIVLHESSKVAWEEISEQVPSLCRGWYELSCLPSADRIEFTREFWLSKQPYHPTMLEFFTQFFASLDDIGVFLTQKKGGDPFEAHLVYSLKEDKGFFHGDSPATEEEIADLQRAFAEHILPADYLAFLEIHDGFSKSTDTGMIKARMMEESYEAFQNFLREEDALVTADDIAVNPRMLIPFYESFGMPCYQCFWGEWHPEEEMGNVHYSGMTNTISDCKGYKASPENLAFPTFCDWLMFYLEKIE